MKPIRIHVAILPIAVLALSQCVVVEPGNPARPGQGSGPGAASQLPGYGQPLTAVRGRSLVTIMEGTRNRSVCHTASPNIEETRFIREQQRIVVKSRGNHGPATVQLFDTASGRELGRVMAYDVRDGNPPWAADMGE